MSDTNERSVASAGSVTGEPVAWAVVTERGLANVCRLQAVANNRAIHCGGEVIPLFAKDKNFSPQAASNAQLLAAIQALVDQTDPWLSQTTDREYKIHTPEHRNARRAVRELKRRLK